MAFNLKSIGDIAKALSSTKDLVSNATDLVSSVKGVAVSKETQNTEHTPIQHEEIFSERIEKLIRLAVADGYLDEDSIEMLERAARKEGLDPDEVIFVTKKRLKHYAKTAPTKLSPAQSLARDLNEIDNKFDSAIESIRMGDSSGAVNILDAFTGGTSGLIISIGKSLFGKSDEEKIWELEELRDEQKARIITSTTLPNNELQVVELLEYVFAQNKAKRGDEEERKAWKSLHESTYNRASLMVAGDSTKIQYIETLKPIKKKFGLF